MYENFVKFVVDFQVLWIPILTMIISQGLKIVIDTLKNRRVDFRDPVRYGGMPSSHSAAVASASVIVALVVGINQPLFFLTILFSLLVIRDALGLRMELTKHAIAINKMIKHLPAGENNSFVKQSERVGHTFWQVIIGTIIGIGLGFLLHWIATLF